MEENGTPASEDNLDDGCVLRLGYCRDDPGRRDPRASGEISPYAGHSDRARQATKYERICVPGRFRRKLFDPDRSLNHLAGLC